MFATCLEAAITPRFFASYNLFDLRKLMFVIFTQTRLRKIILALINFILAFNLYGCGGSSGAPQKTAQAESGASTPTPQSSLSTPANTSNLPPPSAIIASVPTIPDLRRVPTLSFNNSVVLMYRTDPPLLNAVTLLGTPGSSQPAGVVTYHSSDSIAAMVSNGRGYAGLVTANPQSTSNAVTITAQYAGDANYKPATASYLLSFMANNPTMSDSEADQQASHLVASMSNSQ